MLPPTSPLFPDPPPDGSAAIPNSSLCLAAGHLAAFNALSAAAALPILRILNWFPSRLFLFCFTHNSSHISAVGAY